MIAAALAVLSRMGRIPLAVWLAAGLVLWGQWGHRAAQRAERDAKDYRAEQAQIARESERLAAKAAMEAGNEATRRERVARRSAAAAEQRLHALAAAWAASSPAPAGGAACQRDGAPAAALIHEQTRRELVQIAADADAVAGRLIECQRLARRLNGEAVQ